MEKIKKLEQEIKDLEKAFRNKLISVNDYCDTYHAISQQIKKANNY